MFMEWDAAQAAAIIDRHRSLRGALLPMLHALQEQFGYIHDDALSLLADALALSRADVHGVVSFYHDFRRQRPGRHIIRLCVAEACQARGSQSVLEDLTSRLHSLPDDGFTLETVYCLGNCALGPSALVNGRLLGRQNADTLLAEVRS